MYTARVSGRLMHKSIALTVPECYTRDELLITPIKSILYVWK